MSETPISPLRARMIEDMSVRKFGEKTQNDYIRHVKTFSTFLGRSPVRATAEDLRRFQVHQIKEGTQPPTINSSVAALRFFFRVTLNRPEMCRHLTMVRHPVSNTRPPSAWPTAPVCVSPKLPTSRCLTSTASAC